MSINETIFSIPLSEDELLVSLCGHALVVKQLKYGYAIPFEVDSSLYMYFDELKDALNWYMTAHDLWVKV